MILSDVSVKRPVLATVMSILLVTFGAISFTGLAVREMPNTDVPVISISTRYTGASAEIVESRITQVIEQEVSSVSGIDHLSSSSQAGLSSITVSFNIDRGMDAAASDIRDAVARVTRRLPTEIEGPRVSKMDSDAFAIIWFALSSDTMGPMEIADYARRYVIDRLSIIEGVGTVQGGMDTIQSMRIWIDRTALAARGLTVTDVSQALRSENIELPAGEILSDTRAFPVRIARSYTTAEDFGDLVIGEGRDGHLIRLREVSNIERAPKKMELYMRGNGREQLGIGIIKQSTANALEVGRLVKAEVEEIRKTLPEGLQIETSFDTTVFVEKAIEEVYRTMIIATILVVLVIYAFLGSMRAAFVPAIVVPVCLISTFGVLGVFDYSINLMTLLGLVLCIGLVVDDSIVVLENIQRRVDLGEPPILAAYRGARQVAFAVIATTAVIVAVFAPLIFVDGFVGQIFGELGATISGAVIISSFVALTLSPMMCSKLLRRKRTDTGEATTYAAKGMDYVKGHYIRILKIILPHTILSAITLVGIVAGIIFLWQLVPSELAPAEDRGLITINLAGPEGASYDYTVSQMEKIQDILLPYVETGEVERVNIRVPGGWGSSGTVSTGMANLVLRDWNDRKRDGHEITQEISELIAQVPGVRGFAGMSSGMVGVWGPPVSLVVTGSDYETVSGWIDRILAKARLNPNLVRLDTDYKPTKPRFDIVPDRTRAADLGVSMQTIGETLETMLGSSQVTTYIDRGEEYDVIIQLRREDRQEPNDLTNIFVRADRSQARGGRPPGLIPLSNLVTIKEVADVASRKRWNQLQSIRIMSFLAPGYSVGEALAFLEDIIASEIGSAPKLDYTGESRLFKQQGSALMFAFIMALLIVFLVLAAQFESFVHPFVIMLTVPVAIVGGLFGLWLIGSSINVYSQIGLIILVGIAAKNGILIVEFSNQLRDQGFEFQEALLSAAETRFRPIVMTGISTAAGSIPLIVSSGPGEESRMSIGIVIFFGVLFATFMTLFIVPVFYRLMARHTGSPGTIARKLVELEAKDRSKGGEPSPIPAE